MALLQGKSDRRFDLGPQIANERTQSAADNDCSLTAWLETTNSCGTRRCFVHSRVLFSRDKTKFWFELSWPSYGLCCECSCCLIFYTLKSAVSIDRSTSCACWRHFAQKQGGDIITQDLSQQNFTNRELFLAARLFLIYGLVQHSCGKRQIRKSVATQLCIVLAICILWQLMYAVQTGHQCTLQSWSVCLLWQHLGCHSEKWYLEIDMDILWQSECISAMHRKIAAW